ncbi:MAG: peptide ABC transporter substrate-binding protein [Thermodesulfobacteriota bacterium]|nr:MAG: peptide ABC transporter substrate-binding protein [Candidatus Dadabacteria bacterium]
MKLKDFILAFLILLLSPLNPHSEEIKINIGSEPGTLDWNLATDSSSFQIINNIMGGLTRFNENLILEPYLAESWEINKEKNIIKIKIKDKIKWSDGKKLLASHFIDSWERLLNPATGADYAYFLYDIKNAKKYNLGELGDFNLVGVKATDERNIKIQLNGNKSYFMSLLSFMSTFPIRKDVINDHNEKWIEPENIITLGKYKLAKWENHNYILLTPLDAKNKDVLLIMNDNPSSSLAMFENGELDIVDGSGIPLLEIPYLQKKKLLNYKQQFRNNYIGFNVKEFPFDKKIIRKAFSISIDKSAFEKILHKTVIQTESWIPPGLLGNIHNNEKRFNKKLANQILDNNGYKDRSKFPKIKFLFPETGNNRIIAEMLQNMWIENINVPVEIVGLEWKIYLKTLDLDRPNMFRAGWAADYPDPHNFMNLFICNGGNNETGWCNLSYDEKVKMASSETNKKERTLLYKKAQNQLIYDENVIIPLFISNQIYLKNHRLLKVPYSSMGIIDFEKIKLRTKN